jgi:Fe-S cluster assembly iron-binding protein IscA
MLQVTESAAATLADTRSRIGVPDHFGLRIYRGQTDGRSAFAFDFVEEPQDGDQVGEMEQTRYFVAPEVATPLADAVLDTEPTDDGAQLTLKRQE